MKKFIVIFVVLMFSLPSMACARTQPLTKQQAETAVKSVAQHFNVKGGVHTVRAMDCVRYSSPWTFGCVAEALSKVTLDADGSLQQSHCMVNAIVTKNSKTGHTTVHLDNDMYCGQI